MTRCNAFYIVLTLLCCSCASRYEYKLSDFEEAALPEPGTEAYSELGRLWEADFEVRLNKGRLRILNSWKLKKQDREWNEIDLGDGFVYAYNSGAIGGGIFYKKNIPGSEEVRIDHGPVGDIFKWKNQIYVFKIMPIIEDDHFRVAYTLSLVDVKNLSVEWMLEMSCLPQAHFIYDQNLYAVCEDAVYMGDSLKTKVLINRGLNYDHINSMVIVDKKHVYLGHRAGLLLLDLTTGTTKFLRYKRKMKKAK